MDLTIFTHENGQNSASRCVNLDVYLKQNDGDHLVAVVTRQHCGPMVDKCCSRSVRMFPHGTHRLLQTSTFKFNSEKDRRDKVRAAINDAADRLQAAGLPLRVMYENQPEPAVWSADGAEILAS